MRVAVHQPNFLPWRGFFRKMEECDVFVLYDDVQFTKGSYINRTMVEIGADQNPRWLTIPVKYKYLQNINQVSIDNWFNTRFHIKEVIKANYPSSLKVVLPVMDRDYSKLVDLNINLILAVKEHFKLKAEIVRSSQLNYTKGKSIALIDIIKQFNGTEYISGIGGSKYVDSGLFAHEGIKVTFRDYRETCKSVSILEAL